MSEDRYAEARIWELWGGCAPEDDGRCWPESLVLPGPRTPLDDRLP